MREAMDFVQNLAFSLGRERGFSDALKPAGKFIIEHRRDGKIINTFEAPNGITTTAKNLLLNVFFNAGTQPSSNWYVGLIDNSGFTTLAATDTLASHGGWTEFTAYKQGANDTVDRPLWGQGTAANGSITNSSAVVFTFTADGTINGILLCTQGVKASNSGTLWSTASFSAPLNVQTNDTLSITYTLSC